MYHNVLLMIKWQSMWETDKILLGIWSLVCLSDFPSYATFHNKNTVINGRNYETGLVARSYEHGIE